jgi:junctophilin
VTTFGGGPDVPGGWREEGKYRNNVLLTSGKRLFGVIPPLVRSSKQRERIDAAVAAAVRAAQIAAQKSDIANSR